MRIKFKIRERIRAILITFNLILNFYSKKISENTVIGYIDLLYTKLSSDKTLANNTI